MYILIKTPLVAPFTCSYGSTCSCIFCDNFRDVFCIGDAPPSK